MGNQKRKKTENNSDSSSQENPQIPNKKPPNEKKDIKPKTQTKFNLEDDLFSKLNHIELQRAMTKWLKSKDLDTNIVKRDFNHLSTHIQEYLESYVLFGYDLHGQRVLVYSLKSPKDADAIIEFLKKIFIRQQTNDFLSEPTFDDSENNDTDLPPEENND